MHNLLNTTLRTQPDEVVIAELTAHGWEILKKIMEK